MRKIIRLMFAFVVFLSGAGLQPASAAGNVPLFQDDQPPQPGAANLAYAIYLPLTAVTRAYTVSGTVTDASGRPLSGVTVTGQNGETAVTNTAGQYSVAVNGSPASLAPFKSGFMFNPSMLELNLTGNVSGQNFTAVLDCSETITNGSFETTGWWSLVSGGVDTVYSSSLAHSGLRSMRMGIATGGQNVMAESRIRSQAITIPSSATNAALRMWLYPLSTEGPAAAGQPAFDGAAAPEPKPEIDSAFGDATMLYDAQYVRVLDSNTNDVLGTLMYVRSNNGYWSFHEFNLLPFAGKTIKLEIGVYNDGTEGVTSLYLDDVSFQVCGNVPAPPPIQVDSCANQVGNSGFEYNGSWNLPNTNYPAGYSYDTAYTGSRSMRTGIPLYTLTNVESYSDASQTVYIPPGATNVRLKMRLYPRSEEVGPTVQESDQALEPNLNREDTPEEGLVWKDQALGPDAADAQYVLVLNPNTSQVLRYLEWWGPRNSGSGWIYREYDLSAFAGQYVRIQFGTYNNGVGGRSVMYVDDVVLQVCAAPPPPPVCSERITNGGFENNSAWYTPITAFSAGYSTWLRRTGARSMRTGIVYSYHNRYSYSDFRQTVTIPGGVRSASLSFFTYTMSGEALSKEVAMSGRPTAGDLGAEAMSGDVQYLLVLDRYGNWIDTLMWRRASEYYWRPFTFNLNRYIGQTIMLQWGTFNNGYSGVTSMYVDDVSLQACP